MARMLLSDIGKFMYQGANVIHADVPKKAKVVQVGKVENILPDGLLAVNWGRGASRGTYPASKLVIYEPY